MQDRPAPDALTQRAIAALTDYVAAARGYNHLRRSKDSGIADEALVLHAATRLDIARRTLAVATKAAANARGDVL